MRRRRPGQRVAEIDGEPDVQGVGMRLSTAGATEFRETVTEVAQAPADNYTPTGDHDAKTMDQFRAESVNAYKHPTACRERTGLRNPYDVFPHSTSMATGDLDLDHPTPYDVHGPPGQTGDRNAAPLTRRHHRAKTHLGYQPVSWRSTPIAGSRRTVSSAW